LAPSRGRRFHLMLSDKLLNPLAGHPTRTIVRGLDIRLLAPKTAGYGPVDCESSIKRIRGFEIQMLQFADKSHGLLAAIQPVTYGDASRRLVEQKSG